MQKKTTTTTTTTSHKALVYVDDWAVQKRLLHTQNLQKPLEICKYTQDSSWFISISLENWMKSLEKQVYCTHLFLSNQNSNNSNMTQWSIRLLKNDNWTITPFSHISLMPQVSTTIKKNKSFKEKNNQSTHSVIKVHVRPWMAWHHKVQFNHVTKIKW